MKILILTSEFPPGPGGIGTHAHQLALNLHRRGHDPHVLTVQSYVAADEAGKFNEASPFKVEAFSEVPFAPAKAMHRYFRTRARIVGTRPDLVVATGKRAVWIAAAAVRGFGIPWVAIGHGTEFGVRGWERPIVRRTFGSASALVCVSAFTAKQMRECGVVPKRLEIIPNGADHRAFHPLAAAEMAEYRQALGFGSGPLLLTVGNVTERKGQAVVIGAMPRILERCPDTHYLMAGLPTEQASLLKLARNLGVEGRVHFLGRQPFADIVRLMNCVDLFLMTSVTTSTGDCEGFGIAAVEAALCGRAAVVSADSGLSEAVVHNRTGLCVPPGDSEAVAAGVVSLLLDRPRREAMETAARERALREQTWDNRIVQYEDLFASVTA